MPVWFLPSVTLCETSRDYTVECLIKLGTYDMKGLKIRYCFSVSQVRVMNKYEVGVFRIASFVAKFDNFSTMRLFDPCIRIQHHSKNILLYGLFL